VAARHPAVEWIGIAEKNPERGKQVAAAIGADFVSTDHRELLRRPEVTASIIATDEHLHVDPIMASVERGIPMLIEKPLATDLGESARVLKAIEDAKLDAVVGSLVDRYGDNATIIVMSDHGFANFGRQFNLNSWLRAFGYLGPAECTSIMRDVDWSQTLAYGLGINGLYLNLKGRERDGLVEPGEQREAVLAELIARLEAVTDVDGKRVIRGVYRSDGLYKGDATALAPDLIVGYARGYRASWATCLGDLTDEILLDNDSAWSADHCADALEVPGVLFSNRPIRGRAPSLVDLAPTILAEFGLPTPPQMVGKHVFG
jgi:predicted AlkP superfamily phosphohydrolase/phosphomutase